MAHSPNRPTGDPVGARAYGPGVSTASRHLSTIAAYVEAVEARDWAAFAALLHPDVDYEIAQTRERVRGRDRFIRFNTDYPGDWHLSLAESYADERGGVARLDWRVSGEDDGTAIVFFAFDDDGAITRVTDWWPEPYEPPSGRQHLVERY